MTKSKFTGETYFWGIFMLIPLVGLILFSVRGLRNYNYTLGDTLILMLFVTLFYIVINFLKGKKLIIIGNNKLKYYNILKPFGKTIDLNDYKGKIILKESGTGGAYQVIYLVDKQNKTSFKVMGLHYKNFDEINDAIGLKKIAFNPSFSQYFKLLFFERIEIKNNGKNGETVNLIMRVFTFIAIVGIALFMIGFILKRFL